MSPRRRTVARMRRDSAGIRDDAVVLRSSDVAGMRRWTRLRRQQVVLSEKAVQRGAVDPKGAGTYRGSGSNRSSAAPAPLRNKSLGMLHRGPHDRSLCQVPQSSLEPGFLPRQHLRHGPIEPSLIHRLPPFG